MTIINAKFQQAFHESHNFCNGTHGSMKLRSRWLVPPNGWYFPQGSIILRGGTFDGTVALMKKHRAANRMEAGDPERELDEFTCSRAPGLCDGGEPIRGIFADLLARGTSFSQRYSRWALAGFPLVDQLEANRRADICWKCSANQQVNETEGAGCCGKLRSKLVSVGASMSQFLAAPALRNRSTPADNELYTCKICSCPNRVTAWVPLEILDYNEEERSSYLQANTKCWKAP